MRQKNRPRKIMNREMQKIIHNPKKEKINILTIFSNGWDERNLFVDVLRADNFNQTQKETLILSKKTSQFLIKALSDGLIEKKFKSVEILKRGKR